MIQRIQTVYLLVAGLLTATLFKLDFAEILVNDELHVFNAKGIFNGENMIFDGLPVMVFIGLITLLHLVAIFMYKKRIRQIRMVVFTIILLLGLFGLFFYFTYAAFSNAQVAYKVPMAFPLVAIILDYLAIRGIGKDEALIRSLNRIR
jgi:glucan phosphoethanolaminetransferase (alkaline phosphatase superfamily)